jgi:hypothetical protein
MIQGRRVLLRMMAGSKEDAETVTASIEDMKPECVRQESRCC